MKIGFKGEYTMKVHGGKRGEVTLAKFENVITNIGLDRLAAGGVIQYARLGSGTNPESPTDTSLGSQATIDYNKHNFINGVYSYEDTPVPRSKASYTFRFGLGVAKGTHTEVGIGWERTGNTLWSRALIKDINDSPTSITVLDDEVLDVIYTLYMYLDTSIKTYNITHKTVPTEVKMCFHNANGYNWLDGIRGKSILSDVGYYHFRLGGPGSQLGTPFTTSTVQKEINTSSANTKHILEPYVPGSYEQAFKITTDHSSNNTDKAVGFAKVGLFSSSTLSNSDLGVKASFNPPIPKTDTESFTFHAKVSWGRYTG